jgi:septal ring factor EnvC (AmiA/AmiB activator)
MNPKDKSLSNQLEYTQQALDALTTMPSALRNQLAEQEREQRARKAALESHISGFDNKNKR